MREGSEEGNKSVSEIYGTRIQKRTEKYSEIFGKIMVLYDVES